MGDLNTKAVIYETNMVMTKHVKNTVIKVEKNHKITLASPHTRHFLEQESKRKIPMSSANSVTLYVAFIWNEALRIAKYKNFLYKLQRRMAHRCTSAYRTIAIALAGDISRFWSLGWGKNWENNIRHSDLRMKTIKISPKKVVNR